MLKFLVKGKDGRQLVGLGLTEENITRLKGREPITFDLSEVLPSADKNTQVLLYWGTDMVDLKGQVVKQFGLKFPAEGEV